ASCPYTKPKCFSLSHNTGVGQIEEVILQDFPIGLSVNNKSSLLSKVFRGQANSLFDFIVPTVIAHLKAISCAEQGLDVPLGINIVDIDEIIAQAKSTGITISNNL